MSATLTAPIAGQHYWITRRRLPGVVICKWCGLTRSPAAKARRCEPMPQAAPEPATQHERTSR